MYDTIDALLGRMREDLDRLTAAGDARRFFHGTYLRTTEAVVAEIDRGGFLDAQWLRAWDLAFADLYVAALDADLRGAPVSQPWRIAFDATRDRPTLAPLRHVLFGINAHINYDLPQALLAVMTPADFDDPDVMRRREADHRHLDGVLSSRVAAEDAQLTAVSQITVLDRILRPFNRLGTRRFLAEAREKVWRKRGGAGSGAAIGAAAVRPPPGRAGTPQRGAVGRPHGARSGAAAARAARLRRATPGSVIRAATAATR